MAAEGVQYSDAVAWLLRGTASSDASRGRLDSMAIDALFDSVDTRLGGQPSSQPQQAAPAPPAPPAEEPQPPLPWRILQLEVHEGQQRRDATGASYTAHYVRTLIEVVSPPADEVPCMVLGHVVVADIERREVILGVQVRDHFRHLWSCGVRGRRCNLAATTRASASALEGLSTLIPT